MVVYSDELCHHGIKGQKWGTRNGPPYPLDAKGQLKRIKSLNSDLNSWKYGVLIDSKIETDPDKVDWSKYKTIPIDDIKKNHAGICWDFVNYQHHIFKENGYPDESHLFVMQKNEDPNDIVTHTFSIVTIDNQKYWFESSWFKHQGVHPISSYKDVINELVKEYGDANSQYDVYEYNPDGMDRGLTNGEFFKRATEKLVYSNSIKHSACNTPPKGGNFKMVVYSDELCHYGIRGMRWGIRRYQNSDGSLTTAGRNRYSTGKHRSIFTRKKTTSKVTTKPAEEKPKQKSVSEMTDAELNAFLNRKRLEQQYYQLMATPQKKSAVTKGKEMVGKALENAAQDTLTQIAKYTMAKGVNKVLGDNVVNAKVTDKEKEAKNK